MREKDCNNVPGDGIHNRPGGSVGAWGIGLLLLDVQSINSLLVWHVPVLQLQGGQRMQMGQKE